MRTIYFLNECRPNSSKLTNCHSARYEVLAVGYPEHGGSKLLVNIGTDIPQKAGILIDYH
jgi:hypothetical protein